MSKDIYDKISISLKIVRENKLLLLFIISLFVGGTNTGQYFYNKAPVVEKHTTNIVNKAAPEIDYIKVQGMLDKSIGNYDIYHIKDEH